MTTTRTMTLGDFALAGLLQAAAPVPALAHGTGAAAHAAAPAAVLPQLAEVRRATAGFHDVHAAIGAGYAPFQDKNGIYCIDHPTEGAMGIHYVNGGLVGDAVLEATKPEALIYAPMPDGTLRLVGMEYIVFQSAWHAVPGNTQPPRLFGQTFHAGGADNRYGIPAYYALHLWLWDHNPSGLFEDWNPTVRCP
jgi:hypothetical protein